MRQGEESQNLVLRLAVGGPFPIREGRNFERGWSSAVIQGMKRSWGGGF